MHKNEAEHQRAVIIANPELTVVSFRVLGEGHDNIAYLVNDRIVFRFPKTETAVRRLAAEIAVLDELRSILPLEVPNYIYRSGRNEISSPNIFVGYPVICGESMASLPKPYLEEEAYWWRPALAYFLKTLHGFPLSQARKLGVKDKSVSGLDEDNLPWQEGFARLCNDASEVLPRILSVDRWSLIARDLEVFRRQILCDEIPLVLLHGDFTPRHIYIDVAAKKVLGVIDFTDVAIGDPAFDVWTSLLPFYGLDARAGARREFYLRLRLLRNLAWRVRFGTDDLVQEGLAEVSAVWFGSPTVKAEVSL